MPLGKMRLRPSQQLALKLLLSCMKTRRSLTASLQYSLKLISASIYGFVEKHDKVRDLLKEFDEQFTKFEKYLVSTLIIQFSTLRLTRVKGIHDHIMRVMDIAAQLKNLEVTISESFLVHYILFILPP